MYIICLYRLMRLFEAGILTKITEEEYEKLGKKKRKEARKSQQDQVLTTEVAEGNEKLEEADELLPMSMKALQGGFFILIVGHSMAGVFLFILLSRGYYLYVKGLPGKLY